MAHESRIRQLGGLTRCPIKNVPLKVLSEAELLFVMKFIEDNMMMSDRTFKGKAHYLFIGGKDGRDNYPHHIQIIEVLMSICTSY